MKLSKIAGCTLMLVSLATLPGAANKNWNATVVRADGAHVIGNPKAPKITEFVSYTCPHCGTFARTGDEALKTALVGPGDARLEVRHIVRDPVDLTAAMLAWCGRPNQFPRIHAALFQAQPQWLALEARATDGQKLRWMSGPLEARTRAIAADFGFIRIMEQNGFTKAQTNVCLGNTKLAQALADRSHLDAERFGVEGTPSFAFEGKMLRGVHDWPTLEPALRSQLQASKN